MASNTQQKVTGYTINIKFHPIEQHYWVCDPTVPEIRDQPFCGFYDPMTVAEAYELYPDMDLHEFEKHADYNSNGAYQAGSVLNNLAILFLYKAFQLIQPLTVIQQVEWLVLLQYGIVVILMVTTNLN